ncbi:hypothetical protein ACFHYQ_07635 [Sphaerimonospora cavernae]|uniref:DNA-binding protein n=1 Tax=Sphaerimonospora cavernae TaxID=1740611 RepID=A0ABV6U2R7_9ACTN
MRDVDDVPELTADDLRDMCQTLVCLQEAVAGVVVCENRCPQGLVTAGRSKAYQLARDGEFPVRIIRIGDLYRVCTADLMKVLGVDTGGRAI